MPRLSFQPPDKNGARICMRFDLNLFYDERDVTANTSVSAPTDLAALDFSSATCAFFVHLGSSPSLAFLRNSS